MIASNIICRGASRFLNTIYCQDISVSGSATLSSLSLSGNLSVTGTSTLSGHVSVGGYNNTSYGLSANSAIINNWIRTVGSTGWYNESHGGGWWMKDNDYVRSYGKPVLMDHNMYFGTAGDSGYYVKTTGAAKFASVVAPSGSIATLNSTNLSVSNNLHAAHFDLQTVAQLGGSFYVSPTVKFPNSGTKLAVSKSSTQLTLTIKDSSISTSTMAGIVWTANSAVKVSGTINGVVTGTMDGTIDSITNGSQMVVKVSGGNWNSVSATSTDLTSSQFSDLTVMVYQRKQDGNDYRVGIWMNCYDLVNSSSTIRVYGGTSSTPNVTIGNLTGSTFNGETISGNNNWGILTTMGYFEGAIVSTEGQIGGWTIGDTKLYHNTNSITSTDAGLYLGTDGIRNYSSGTQYVNITSGKITALGVDVSGKITATSGAIGGFDITSTAIKTKDVAVTSNADNSISLSSADFTRTINSTSRAGLRFAIGDKFGVTGDGVVYATGANISGELNADTGHIGGSSGWTIASQQLSNGTIGSDASMFLATKDLSATIAGASRTGLRLTVGSNFGVDKTGIIYATGANISGAITATSLSLGTGVTIPQSGVANLTTDLGNKASTTSVTAIQNQVNAVYGTSDTAASTATKAVTCSNFTLYDGALISVKFGKANTSTGAIKLNVNSTGEKSVYVNNTVTSSANQLLWAANAVITFRYNGSQFVVIGEPRIWYGESTTAAATAAKTDTTAATGCVICKGTIVKLTMTYANTATAPTLNIRSTGAKNLYAGIGTSTRPMTSNGLGWTAGATVEFVFDGQYWRIGDTAALSRAREAQLAADDAATTATNYITADSSGIKVHNASNLTDYVQIINDGTHIYKGSSEVAYFGATARVGLSTAEHVAIDSDSIDIMSGNATLASFGSTCTINNILATSGSIGGFSIYRGIIESRALYDEGTTEITEMVRLVGLSNNGDYVFYAGTAVHENIEKDSTWTDEDWAEAYRNNIMPEIVKNGFSVTMDGVVTAAGGSSFGNQDAGHVTINDNGFDMSYGNTSLLKFNYGSGTNSSGGTSVAPYYTFGNRLSSSSNGNYSFSSGAQNTASGYISTAMGYKAIASGYCSVAIGEEVTASTTNAIAMGRYTTASGLYSTAMGYSTTASNTYSTAMGSGTTASGQGSIAMGRYTTASGHSSTAMGYYSIASNDYSTSIGYYTVASGKYNFVIGKYNKATVSGDGTTESPYTYTNVGDYAFIIGNGGSNSTNGRSNALTVDWNGNLSSSGAISGTDITASGAIKFKGTKSFDMEDPFVKMKVAQQTQNNRPLVIQFDLDSGYYDIQQVVFTNTSIEYYGRNRSTQAWETIWVK